MNMNRSRSSLALPIAIALLSAQAASGQRSSPMGDPRVVRLHDGRNALDIVGDGGTGEVDIAVRENFNAHGHHVAIFFVRAPLDPVEARSPRAWQVVPFFGLHGDSLTADELFGTTEGADCTLRDLRVIAGSGGRPVTVVVGERELAGGYADSASVRFQYYELRVNRSESVGYPTYRFAPTRVVQAKGRYCDVDDAFQQELGLGGAGLVEWNGPR